MSTEEHGFRQARQSQYRFWPIAAICVSAVCQQGQAQEKVTFQDHVLPLVEANCAKCHNSDKKKGDLDLTSYGATLAGGASGKVVAAGDPDSSKLIKVMTHAEEPTMPPNRGKMADKEIAVFKKWIAGGLLETLSSKAIAGKPTVDLALGASVIGKPDGPPPLPGDLLMDPFIPVKRTTAITGLAASPWAPVIAVAGQKQVVLYHSDSLDVLGVLPFKDEAGVYQPEDVKFSRNGKLLVAGGGHAAKTGRVLVFDITTGERIISVGAGQEFDSALASDISPDQSKIVFGGPSRMVKVFSTKEGSVLFKMKKHTDWVTAAAFSPNGEWLATADRNGAVVIWDADNGLEIHTTAGHKSGVTAMSWRADSKLVASSSEDGSVKIWEMNEGKQVRTWNAHKDGALSVSYTHDGRLVTCGRDNQVVAWGPDGAKQKAFTFTNELPVRVTFSHDGERVFASDWTGRITAWNTKTGKVAGELAANPPTLAEQLAAAQQRLRELESGSAKASPEQLAAQQAVEKLSSELDAANAKAAEAKSGLDKKEAEVERLKAVIAKKSTPELQTQLAAAREVRNKARLEVTNTVAALKSKQGAFDKAKSSLGETAAIDPEQEKASLKARIAKLKAAQAFASVYALRESIAEKKRTQESLLGSGSKAAAEKLGKEIAKQEKELERASGEHARLKTASADSAEKPQAKL
jgi:hypothetical protein